MNIIIRGSRDLGHGEQVSPRLLRLHLLPGTFQVKYYGLCITYPLRYFQGPEIQDGPAAGQTALLPGLLRQAAGPLRQHPHRTRIVTADCDTNDY